MRLSANPSDPGYRAYRALPRCIVPVVYLDGVELSKVVVVDTKRGCVVVEDTRGDGRRILNARGDAVLHRQLFGAVRIEFARRADQ
jgi:hypothetical protein